MDSDASPSGNRTLADRVQSYVLATQRPGAVYHSVADTLDRTLASPIDGDNRLVRAFNATGPLLSKAQGATFEVMTYAFPVAATQYVVQGQYGAAAKVLAVYPLLRLGLCAGFDGISALKQASERWFNSRGQTDSASNQ